MCDVASELPACCVTALSPFKPSDTEDSMWSHILLQDAACLPCDAPANGVTKRKGRSEDLPHLHLRMGYVHFLFFVAFLVAFFMTAFFATFFFAIIYLPLHKSEMEVTGSTSRRSFTG